ncbi:MAG: preprotein translocase subunit SecG [bacterium]|nr:preprotein translocase subunit SecG [bacterium]
MYGVLLGFHVLVVVLLIVVILMQQREGGFSTAFGGGGQSVFGGRGAAPFLTKTTVVLLALFIITSFSLTILGNKRVKYETAVEKAIKKGEMQTNMPAEKTPAGNIPAGKE